MAVWPTITEAIATVGNINAEDQPELQQCLDAAVEYIDYRTVSFTDVDTGVLDVPETARRAVLLLTSRLYRRRQSPEGVAQFADTGPIRVARVDPDVEQMILPHRSWGVA